MSRLFFLSLFILCSCSAHARLINATPDNYTEFLTALVAGDTLSLAPGTYTRDLPLRDLNGTENDPIVITGSPTLYATVFAARGCCNTVSITRCSFVVIRNLELNGGGVFVDAVKGEGTAGNWAHHITLEYLNIVGYNADQQSVGISTKCPAWNWTIRKNRIIGAGTGLYLGNSDGGKPFVNGLIEDNLVMNTIGYNMEIKHQRDGERELQAGTAVEGRTVIRRNVFCKDQDASTGAMARPNVLLGAFPSTGPGAEDVYEVYGNFFYQNPNEALLQVTGNTALYANVFVNHFDPSGFRAVYVTAQNGFQPRRIWVFHNTVWAANTAGGIRLYNPNTAYTQYCHANAVFSAQPVTNFPDAADNVTGAYADAASYLLSATTDLTGLDLYPRQDMLVGSTTTETPFSGFTDAHRDFNGAMYDWRYRGGYSGCCVNPGWKLQLDTMSHGGQGTSSIASSPAAKTFEAWPNPATSSVSVRWDADASLDVRLSLHDLLGRIVCSFLHPAGDGRVTFPLHGIPHGMYVLRLHTPRGSTHRRIIVSP